MKKLGLTKKEEMANEIQRAKHDNSLFGESFPGASVPLAMVATAKIPYKNFPEKLKYMAPTALVAHLAESSIKKRLSEDDRLKRAKNIEEGKKDIGKGIYKYPLVSALSGAAALGLSVKALEQGINELKKRPIRPPEEIFRGLKKITGWKSKWLLPSILAPVLYGIKKSDLSEDGVHEDELEKKSSEKKKIPTKRDFRLQDEAIGLTASTAITGGELGRSFIKKLYNKQGLNPPMVQSFRGFLLGSLIGGGLGESLLSNPILKKRLKKEHNLKGVSHLPILAGLAGASGSKLLTSILAPSASRKTKALNMVLGGLGAGLHAKNLITEKTAEKQKPSLEFPIEGASTLAGLGLGALIAKKNRGIISKIPSLSAGALFGKEVGKDLGNMYRKKRDGANAMSSRESQIRGSASGVLPLITGGASLLGANEIGKIIENYSSYLKDKKSLINIPHEFKYTPSKKRLAATGVAGLLGLAGGGLLAKETIQKREKGVSDKKTPLISALASGLISGILTKGTLSKFGPSVFSKNKLIGLNSALGALAGGLYGDELLTEKTPDTNHKGLKKEGVMKKQGLDRAYYKQKAKKSCAEGLDKAASLKALPVVYPLRGFDKLAASDSTGVSQLKQRKTTTRKKYTAEGTGLGAAGGGFAGYKITKALGPKWNIPSTLAGIALGGLAGRHVGRKGSKTKTKSIEGVVKRQEKRKDSPAKLPSLKRENVKGLLAYNS